MTWDENTIVDIKQAKTLLNFENIERTAFAPFKATSMNAEKVRCIGLLVHKDAPQDSKEDLSLIFFFVKP